MILTFTPNPCVDKTIFLEEISLGGKMRAPRYDCIAGGKGVNVARAVHTMGRHSTAMVVVGGHTGKHVVEMIAQNDGVPCLPVWVDAPTRTITTVLEEKHHRQTAFFEPGSTITEADRETILSAFAGAVQGARLVTLNGAVSDRAIETIYRDLIGIASDAGVQVVLDTYGPELTAGLEAAPYAIKPNREEAAAWVGFALDSPAALRRAAERFHDHGVVVAIISLGAEGVFVSSEGGAWHVTPPAIHEVNPVGSGDSLVAGIAIGIAEGMPIPEAAALGCAMGTANAMTWDIGHFTAGEVDSILAEVRVKVDGSPHPRQV